MLKRKENARLWSGFNERHFTLDFDQGVLYYGYSAKDKNWRKPIKLLDIERVEKVDRGWMQIDVDDAESTGSTDFSAFAHGEPEDVGQRSQSPGQDRMVPTSSTKSAGEASMGPSLSSKSLGAFANPRPPVIPAVKAVILGSANVGKTSLVVRYCRNTFSDKVPSTVGVDFLQRQDEVDGQQLKVRVWDTAGQERHLSSGVAPLLFRDANAVLIVFDCLAKASFERCSQWISQVRTQVNPQSVAIMLAANKVDKASEGRAVRRHEAEKFAEEEGLLYAEVSAKTGEGVQQAMKALLRRYLELDALDRPQGRGSFPLTPPNLTEQERSGCRC